MRDIKDLIRKQPATKTPAQALDELNRKQYLADLERMRDFRPEGERMRWPNPIRPHWKN